MAEPFDKQEELDQKTRRYNEVMEILNPPDEQLITDDEDDDTQYQRRSYDDDIQNDIYYPRKRADASAFIRSFANKTSGLKRGKKKKFVVYTADDVYFVTATGYLTGEIEKVMPILSNEEAIDKYSREFLHGIDESTETTERWAEAVRSGDGRVYRNNAAHEDAGTAMQTDVLDGGKPESNAIGYTGKSFGNSSVTENSAEELPVGQRISSAKTSIKQIPALFKDKNVHFHGINVDIGGGKFDLATDFLAQKGVKNYLFDPYNRPEAVNAATLSFLQSGNRADTVTCANVLNVIAELPARANVVLEAAKAVKKDGTAYFMVYEGDGSGIGRKTASGWQNNRKTADYVDEISHYFRNVVRKGKLIIATYPEEDIPKAAWEISPGKAVQYQRREATLSDREALSRAAYGLNVEGMTDAQKGALDVFKRRIDRLSELEMQRRYVNSHDRAEIKRTAVRGSRAVRPLSFDEIKRHSVETFIVKQSPVHYMHRTYAALP